MKTYLGRHPVVLDTVDLIALVDTGSTAAIAETDTPALQALVEVDFNSPKFVGPSNPLAPYNMLDVTSFMLKGLTVNGQGGTPTSPGAAVKIYINWYWSDAPVALADVTKILANTKTSANVTLPPVSTSDASGTRHWHFTTAPLQVLGRYLYVGMNRDAFAANALIDLNVRLARVARQ